MTTSSLTPQHSSVVGGSTAARRIFCPGSLALERDAPPQPPSEYAETGTALHEVMEYLLLDIVDDNYELNDLVGFTFNNIVITTDHVNHKIRPAVNALNDIATAAGGLDMLVEVKASLNRVIEGAFGTIDVLAKGGDGKLYVIDWKFGDGVQVNAKQNMQLAFYTACAMYDEDPDVMELVGNQALDVVFCIIQPTKQSDATYSTWETDSEYIENFIDALVDAIDVAQSPEPPIKAGDHCKFCKALSSCPVQRRTVGMALAATPTDIDVFDLSNFIAMADQVEQWAKAVRQRAHKALEDGVKIPGYKLVPKRAQRKYNDEDAATRVLVRHLKTAEAYEPRKLISPAQAEKKLGKQKYGKLVKKYVSMISSGNTLAPDTDPRPDVSDELTQLAEKVPESQGALFDNKRVD